MIDMTKSPKNCPVSAEMHEKHDGRHLTNTVDAAAANVRRTGARAPAKRKGKPQP